MIRKIFMMVLFLSLAAFVACGDDSDEDSNNANNPNNTAANNPNNTGENNTNNETGNNSNNTGENNNNETNNTTNNETNNSTNNETNNLNNTNNSTIPRVQESCDEASLEGCAWNGDCEPVEVCRDIGATDTEVACCIPGSRGTAQLGEVCTDESDGFCNSGICIEGDGPDSVCSQPCEEGDVCPDGYTCNDFLFLCLPDDF